MNDPAPLTANLPTVAEELARELAAAGFTADSIAAHLGPEATEALYRREPGVVLDACGDDSRLAALIRFFLLRRPATAEQLAETSTVYPSLTGSLAEVARQKVLAGGSA